MVAAAELARLREELAACRAALAGLIDAATQRDGGAHDADCRIHRPHREPVHCNCGHDDLAPAILAARDALARMATEGERTND